MAEKKEERRADAQKEIRQSSEEIEALPEETQIPTPAGTASEDDGEINHELPVDQTEPEVQNYELQQAQRELELARDRYLELYDFAPVGYFTISQEGLIAEANLTAATLLGVDRARLLGQPLSRFILAQDQDTYHLHRRKLFETQEPQICQMRMARKNGSRFWARMEATLALDSDGQAVCRATVSDVGKFKQAEEALRRSEEKYRALVEQSLQGIVIVQGDPLRIAFANPTCAAILGCTVEQLLAMPAEEITALMHPEDRALISSRLQDRLTGRPPSSHYEARIVRKDGSVRWVTILGSLIEHEGSPAVQASLLDITERKQAEEQLQEALHEKELLLQEVHHRVKNNLQIISSLLDLQSESIEDSQVVQIFRDSQNRVRSMGLLHDELYRSENLARIAMADYAESMAHYLFEIYGDWGQNITLEIQADDVWLGTDAAIPCGLIISELVSNALKYAFPAGESGEIRIEIHPEDDGQIALVVGDDGIGLSPDLDIHNPRSLGLRLVRMLTRQLGGTLELDTTAGTTFKVTFAERFS